MIRIPRRGALALPFAGLAGPLAAPALAQAAWPDRPVNMIVPFAPGGTPDIGARLVQPKMSEFLGQPVTVENRAGAGSTIGTRAVVQARPDGHTVLMGSISFLTAPLTAQPMPFDPVETLRCVSLVSTSPYVVVVRADSPARDIAGFHALARQRGAAMNYGSAGNGTPFHLGAELYKLKMGVDMTHIAYRGTGPSLVALLAGEVDVLFCDVPGATPHIRSGAIRPLGTMVANRIAQLPDVPTLAESDPRLSDYDVYTWAMLVAPKATPDGPVNRLNEAVLRAARAPEVAARFAELGFDYVGSTPADGDARLAREKAKWTEVIRAANIRVDL
ncbi:tripartite tricarboxylate transporter substrate binding protein [Roseococcus sp. SYP-B2431]|uniref:Bug family tripartite tricarboxylate transporter substrate binding protein n=1 Tax=Roseococcus sp. SYP-B2431 TaxID=2496640 RepID=UPI001039676B|nr:tripartite tricarboxylate transporter substrate binding protein [Roseococcus sp. SYP-B2431]TCH99981.1 tripartite tricarboxylate transporter substrate binding protein [Roseococcus sp. SYP-B2431]